MWWGCLPCLVVEEETLLAAQQRCRKVAQPRAQHQAAHRGPQRPYRAPLLEVQALASVLARQRLKNAAPAGTEGLCESREAIRR